MARRASPILSLFLVLVLAALGLAAIYGTRPDPPRPLAPIPSAAPVHVRELAAESRPLTVRIYGEASAWRQARPAVEQSGTVVWRSPRLENGGRVAAGEELLRLDAESFVLALAEAEAALAQAVAEQELRQVRADSSRRTVVDYRTSEDLARREAERQAELVVAGDSAEAVRDNALQALAAATAALKQAEQAAAVDAAAVSAAAAAVNQARAARDRAADAVDRCRLLAPFSGEVSSPSAEVGDWLLAGTPVCLLVDRERLKVRAPLPNGDAVGVAPGGEVRVTVPALVGEDGRPATLTGTVLGIDPVATPAARARELVAEIGNAELRLPVGAFVELEVGRGEMRTLWLRPMEYRVADGRSVAFVVDADGRAEARELELGRPIFDGEDRAWHPVLAGLSPGESLAFDNLEMLEHGVELRILED